jgi:hypothetical protein
MSAGVYITCNCIPDCGETAIVDDADTRTEARVIAHRLGWRCDVVGGNTLDTAPGHEITAVSSDTMGAETDA